MVHQSTLVVKNRTTGIEIARLKKKIHEDSNRWDDVPGPHNEKGVKVSAFTYNKLNPFSMREDTIKWKVEVKCEHCSQCIVGTSECTGFSNVDKSLVFLCKCGRTDMSAEFIYTKCPPGVPLAIAGGAAAVAGGVVVTTCSFGLAAPLGGALIGGGMSAVCEAGAALSTGELDEASLAANVAAGAAMGAFSGGVGALGESALKNVGSGALKLGARAAIGAVASAGSKAIGEVKDCSVGNKEWNKYGQAKDSAGNYTASATVTSWTTDVVAGAAGGAVCHANSNISKAMAGKGGLLKAATRTAVSTAAASATNAAGQGVAIATGNQKDFDTSRLLTTTIATATLCAAQEGAKNAKYAANGGKHAMLRDKTDTKFIKDEVGAGDDQAVQDVKSSLRRLREADAAVLDACNDAATARPANEAHAEVLIAEHQAAEQRSAAATAEHRRAVDAQKQAPRALKKDLQAQVDSTKAAKTQAADATQKALGDLQDFKATYENKEFLPNDPSKLHALHSDHASQFAADVNATADNRGARRFLFDRHADGSVLPAGYTAIHDYAGAPQHGASTGQYQDTKQQYYSANHMGNNIAYTTVYQTVNNRAD